MAVETIHVVQGFTVNEWGEYGPDEPKAFKTGQQAQEYAARIHEGGRPAIAFSRSGDPSIGEYGDPILLTQLGEIPPDVLEYFCGENA